LASIILSLSGPGAIRAAKLVSPREASKAGNVRLAHASSFDYTLFNDRSICHTVSLRGAFLHHTIAGWRSDIGRPVLDNRILDDRRIGLRETRQRSPYYKSNCEDADTLGCPLFHEHLSPPV
jgi:hypothetical protein